MSNDVAGGTMSRNPANCDHDWIGWRQSFSFSCSKYRVENLCRHCCVRMVSEYNVCELIGMHQWQQEPNSGDGKKLCAVCYEKE